MKRKYIVTLLVMIVLILSCSISIASDKSTYDVSIYLGDQINLREYIRDRDINFVIDNQAVIQNLNASILSVNSSYVVKAKDVGTSVLIVSNENQSMTLRILVESSIEAIELEHKFVTLLLGEIYDLKYAIKSKGDIVVSNVDIEWTSSKPRVATIVNGDKIYTKAAGETTFTGKTINGDILVSFELTVLGHSEKIRVISEERIRSMDVGEEISLNAYFGTKDVTESIEWESLTPHVVTVNEHGIVMAIGEGRGEIRAKTTDTNNKVTYELDAYSMIDRVELNNTLIKFKGIGQTYQLFFNLYPKDKNNPPIKTGYKYVSSNEDVAVVSSNGLVTSKGPGIALVSVIFDDSQKRAACTVEVPDNDEIIAENYIPVQRIELLPYDQTALIGEKIKLDYLITPENASDHRVSFNIPHGDNDQISEIDGAYYFVPNKRGNIKIELFAADEAKDAISLSTTSPIESMDLSLSTRRKISLNEEKLYIGEMAELLTRAYARSGYQDTDIFPSSLNYTIDDESVAKIINYGNRYYIRALKAGKTEIHVENLEGMHDTILWISVENPIKGVTTDSKVTLPLDKLYRPRVGVDLISSAANISDSFDVNEIVTIDVKNFYLSELFIDQEIDYEKIMMNNSKSEMYEKNRIRLNQLLGYKSNVKDGYVEIYDLYALKNRSGYNYKFYDVRTGKVVGYYPSKIFIEIGLKNTVYKAESIIELVEDKAQFRIKRLNKVYDIGDLIKQFSLSYVLGNVSVDEQIDLFITYLNTIERFDEIPRYEVLKALSSVEEDISLTELVKTIGDEVTHGDLAKLSVALHKKYINKNTLFDNQSSYYYDVVASELSDAISLNHVTAQSDDYFGTNTRATENDFYEMVRSILPYYTISGLAGTTELTFERMIVLLSELIN